jgi:RNA polymerase sigma-70 factor (ECF subfamily)
MTEAALELARAGDQHAFRELTDPYRRELQVHCYRIVGSLQDAEDLLQETLLAAWRGLERFEGRASLRSWLYRIATNRCLNALRDSGRRPRETPAIPEPPEPTRRAEPVWLQPYPDALLDGVPDDSPGPAARYETREAIGLAFVTALNALPPRQRAVLVLRDVLGYRAAETADMLDTTEIAVKAALQRARTTLEARVPSGSLPDSPHRRELTVSFADAVEAGDVDRIVSLLTDDAWLTMPPYPFEYQGHAAIAAFLRDRAALRGGPLRLVGTGANGQPAFGAYLPEAGTPSGLLVLTLAVDRISAITWFGDAALFAAFGLPRSSR